jgi:hypothetical protein
MCASVCFPQKNRKGQSVDVNDYGPGTRAKDKMKRGIALTVRGQLSHNLTGVGRANRLREEGECSP